MIKNLPLFSFVNPTTIDWCRHHWVTNSQQSQVTETQSE